MKKIAGIVIGIIITLLIVSVAKDIIIKAVVEKGVEIATGLKLRIGTFRVGLINRSVDIRDLRLLNPRGFKDRTMIEMPEIYAAYDLASSFKGKIHMPEARLNLKEFVVVKNERGELNINSLKVVRAQESGARPAAKSAKGAPPKIQIDSLKLKIGKVIYKDYSQGREPLVKEFDVNIDESYRNIDDAYSLVSLIVVRSMAKTTIANLANFDLRGLEGTISGTLSTAQKTALKAVAMAGATVATTKVAAEKTEEAAKEAVSALKDLFKSPFGSKE